MKKYSLLLTVLVAVLSFYGCNTTKNVTSSEDPVSTEELIVTEDGVTYLRDYEKAIDITCGYFDYTEEDGERKEFEIEDSSFYNKLKKVINGKEMCEYSCNCAGDYQVSINDEYLLLLHPDRITVNIDLKGHRHCEFTVECSKEEMKELYDFIESHK